MEARGTVALGEGAVIFVAQVERVGFPLHQVTIIKGADNSLELTLILWCNILGVG